MILSIVPYSKTIRRGSQVKVIRDRVRELAGTKSRLVGKKGVVETESGGGYVIRFPSGADQWFPAIDLEEAEPVVSA